MMPLTGQQKSGLLIWFKDHDVPPACPICGMIGESNLYDRILDTRDLAMEEKKAKVSSMGFLVLTCKHCMHSLFFAISSIIGRS